MTGSTPARSSPVRRVLIGLLLVLACLGITLSTIAVWAHQTVLGTDRFVAAVSRVAANQAVQARAADRLAEEIVVGLDVQGRIAGVLPERQAFLAVPLTNAVQGVLERRLTEFMGTKQAQDALLAAMGFAHERVIRVLRSESDFVSIEGSTVRLDLLPVAVEGMRALQEAGILPATVTLPDVTDPAGRDAAIANLESRLGRDLPDDFATLAIADAPRLAAAQTAVRAFDVVTVAIVVITVALIVATIWLARRRLRMVAALALGAVVALALARILVRGAVNGVAASLAAGGSDVVIDDIIRDLTTDLAAWSWILIILGLVVAATAVVLGRPAWMTDIRAETEATAGTGPGEAEAPGAAARAEGWLRRHAAGVAWSVAILLVVIVLWIATSPELAIIVGVGLVTLAASGVVGRGGPDVVDGPPSGQDVVSPTGTS